MDFWLSASVCAAEKSCTLNKMHPQCPANVGKQVTFK